MNYFCIAFVHFCVCFIRVTLAVRPSYENDEELCPFLNKPTINDAPAEMTPRITGMKYFRRLNESREIMSADKARSMCKMYNLEPAEIIDQDDYNEAITIVRETGWSFWIAVRGNLDLDSGNYHFDFKLADGFTKIGFHDLGPQSFTTEVTERFKRFEEGCVYITPTTLGVSGVTWAKAPCTELHDILCQYKKSCYKRSDYTKDPTRPIKRLMPLIQNEEEDSGYAISTIQASWPFAKQVCEDAGMSLVWFDDDKELDAFNIRISMYALDRVQYINKPFWTAGRFSPWNSTGNIYDKLYWWKHNSAYEVSDWNVNVAREGQTEHSGGFLKHWGKDREVIHLGKNEPYDEGLQGKERCVDVSFSDVAEFFTSKCDKTLRHFICKNADAVKQALSRAEASEPSSMAYCTEKKYYKTSEKDCNGEVIFAGPAKPDCTCFSGVHALMADVKCKPKLLVGTGCVKLKAKSSLHWKILPSQIIHNRKPWIVVAHSADDKVEQFSWFAANIDESGERQILGAVTFYFSGFILYRDEESDSHDVCFVVDPNMPSDEFYEYSVYDLPSLTFRYYNYPSAKCNRPKVSTGKFTSHTTVSADGNNECEIPKECLDGDAEATNGNNPATANSTSGGGGGTKPKGEKRIYVDLDGTLRDSAGGAAHGDGTAENSGGGAGETGCEEGDPTCDENDIHQDAGIESPSKKGKAEGDIEDANDNVNRQLLIYAIEVAFPHFTGPADTLTGPKNTWVILAKIFELAKQACAKMVRPEFLARVFKYFRIAHFGENYEYGEYFTESETKQALTMLDSCHERANNFREMEVEVDSCTGKAWRVTLENKTREIITRSADDTGYQSVFHHHVMEATWDVIDLWNAVCLTEFKSSYLLFHHIERGLEVLFNDKLRKLWHFPNVTEEYFQKLLGPDEGIQLLNLDQCVQAAYKGNMRINRMGRPNRGMNAVVGQMIRNRLDDEKLKDKGIPRSNGHPGNFTAACIRGATVRCHRRIPKNKKNRPKDTLLALAKKFTS